MRRLVITESNGIVRVDNGSGQLSQAVTVEKAVRKAASRLGIVSAPELEVRSVFDMAVLLTELMGTTSPTEQIQEGVQSA